VLYTAISVSPAATEMEGVLMRQIM